LGRAAPLPVGNAAADDEDGDAVARAAGGDAGEPVPEVGGVTAGERVAPAAPLPVPVADAAGGLGVRDEVGKEDAAAEWAGDGETAVGTTRFSVK
jgi:hypothetical protein